MHIKYHFPEKIPQCLVFVGAQRDSYLDYRLQAINKNLILSPIAATCFGECEEEYVNEEIKMGKKKKKGHVWVCHFSCGKKKKELELMAPD